MKTSKGYCSSIKGILRVTSSYQSVQNQDLSFDDLCLPDHLDEFYFRWTEKSVIEEGKAAWISMSFNHLN